MTTLPTFIDYAVAVNDYSPEDPITILAEGSSFFMVNSDNPGYGTAVNRLLKAINIKPGLIGILNTDIQWNYHTFESIIDWMDTQPDVHLLVPQITNSSGQVQKLCKQNPTILGLFSRRFVPLFLKPKWLKRYDEWYTMANKDYSSIFDVPYLSGCCMIARTSSFIESGGFDQRYFLYLEDADLTRSMRKYGRCIHFPYVSVVHSWGRGNYRNIWLMLINIVSAFIYFKKWGIAVW